MELIEVHALVIATVLLIHILGAVILAASTTFLGFLILVVILAADASKTTWALARHLRRCISGQA